MITDIVCCAVSEQRDYFDCTSDLGLLSFSLIYTHLLLNQLQPTRRLLFRGPGPEISCALPARSGRSDPGLPRVFCNEGTSLCVWMFSSQTLKGTWYYSASLCAPGEPEANLASQFGLQGQVECREASFDTFALRVRVSLLRTV